MCPVWKFQGCEAITKVQMYTPLCTPSRATGVTMAPRSVPHQPIGRRTPKSVISSWCQISPRVEPALILF